MYGNVEGAGDASHSMTKSCVSTMLQLVENYRAHVSRTDQLGKKSGLCCGNAELEPRAPNRKNDRGAK